MVTEAAGDQGCPQRKRDDKSGSHGCFEIDVTLGERLTKDEWKLENEMNEHLGKHGRKPVMDWAHSGSKRFEILVRQK